MIYPAKRWKYILLLARALNPDWVNFEFIRPTPPKIDSLHLASSFAHGNVLAFFILGKIYIPET